MREDQPVMDRRVEPFLLPLPNTEFGKVRFARIDEHDEVLNSLEPVRVRANANDSTVAVR